MNRIIGIDLGTSTSEAAVLVDGKPMVIENYEGELITPSVVGISQKGNIIVGEGAKEQLILRPDDTIMEVKRLMGTGNLIKLGDRQYTPEEISSYILKYLKECAEKYLGDRADRAVITVPAYFTDEQRKATVRAGELAGLKVERIINEPTAAALAYGIGHMEENSHILVYDLGGGTLDVTLLEMFEGVLEVKASSGNNCLGGKDFDEKLMELLTDSFEGQYGADISGDKRAMARIKEASEKCKIALSSFGEYNITLPFLTEKDDSPLGIDMTITRDMFESLIGDLILSTSRQIDIVLKDGKVDAGSIDLVLMVGGSTRIPYVRKFLKDTLGKDPESPVDPDLAVVMGAAVQAGIINEELSGENDIIITDVCPYTLGIETMSFSLGIPVTDVYDVVIPRNQTVPVIREKIYSTAADYQESVEIKVYQGDHKKASLNNFLGKFKLSGIPPAEAFKEKIKIKFMYDINGILKVEAVILSTGRQAEITIETTGVKTEDEIDLSGWIDAPAAKKYRRILKRGEKALEEMIDHEDYDELDRAVYDLKYALIKGTDEEKLDELEEKLSDVLYDMEEEE